MGDSAVTINYFAWVDQRQTDFVKARSEAIRLVKTALEDAGMAVNETNRDRIGIVMGTAFPLRTARLPASCPRA